MAACPAAGLPAATLLDDPGGRPGRGSCRGDARRGRPPDRRRTTGDDLTRSAATAAQADNEVDGGCQDDGAEQKGQQRVPEGRRAYRRRLQIGAATWKVMPTVSAR